MTYYDGNINNKTGHNDNDDGDTNDDGDDEKTGDYDSNEVWG